MNDASWDRITDAIDNRYGLERHGRLQRELPERHDLQETVQFVEFMRDGDQYRLERVSGPAIIDRKTVGARRAGAAIHYENVYDESETSTRLVFMRHNGTDWIQIEPSELGL